MITQIYSFGLQNYTHKNVQVVTKLLSSRYQDVFTLFVPSCCDKSDEGNRFATSCTNKSNTDWSYNKLRYELVVINLLTTCYLQMTSDLLEQLVESLLASSTLLQDDTNLFQTYQQLGTSIVNTSCSEAVRFYASITKSLENQKDQKWFKLKLQPGIFPPLINDSFTLNLSFSDSFIIFFQIFRWKQWNEYITERCLQINCLSFFWPACLCLAIILSRDHFRERA